LGLKQQPKPVRSDFPEGASPLCVEIKALSISKWQAGLGRPMQ
jgi:hypothetical protein